MQINGSGELSNIEEWTLLSDNGNGTYTSTRTNKTYAKLTNIPKTGDLSDGTVVEVTSIADSCFENCTTIDSTVEIANSVVSIGSSAFAGSSVLKLSIDNFAGAVSGTSWGVANVEYLRDFSIAEIPSQVYTGSAIGLESDNLLTELAGNAATGTVTDKVDEYLSKVGIKKGTLSFTFKDDGTFTATLKKKTVSGNYTIADDNKTISMKYGQQLQWMSMTGSASLVSSKLTLLFDADRLMSFINTIAQFAGTANSTIGTLATLLSQYDGMDAGFSMTKK